MSKSVIPLISEDISTFARQLATQLKAENHPAPTHLSLMNMLARAAGFRNFQHMRAAHTSGERLADIIDPAIDHKLVERALNQFDAQGRLKQWPAKRAVQELCLWVMWSHLPSRKTLHERDVNGVLNQAHLFEDPAILRRSLIGMKLISRNLDGSDYQRQEDAPSPEARELIHHIAARRGDA